MSKDKEKMTKEEKIKKATELIEDLNALELTDEEMGMVNGGIDFSGGAWTATGGRPSYFHKHNWGS